jgi:putative membrane protein
MALMLALTVMSVSCNKDDDEDAVSQTDQNFMMKAAYANNAEISAGGMAATKANSPAVASFGQMMVNDHTTAKTELMTLAGQMGMALPQGLDSMHQQLAQQLTMLTGMAFDSTYINSQVMDHQTAIQLFQSEANTGNDPRLVNYAQKYLPKLQMHLQMADSIKMGM